MIEYIYAFGSICRGELDNSSDIDLLVITENRSTSEINIKQSCYKKKTLNNLWLEGNPFAWHLHKESKMIYTSDGNDYLSNLGNPSRYSNLIPDLSYLRNIFVESKVSIMKDNNSIEFDFSTIFLVIRNIATCYELGVNNRFCFSRDSAIQISNNKLNINTSVYETIKTCRILSTRGIGFKPTQDELNNAKDSISEIEFWIENILKISKKHESIQTKIII